MSVVRPANAAFVGTGSTAQPPGSRSPEQAPCSVPNRPDCVPACGHWRASVSGEAWAKEFGHLPNLEQVTRDGGTGLAKGVALVNEQRHQQERPLVVDQGDHVHALRSGGVGLRKAALRARQTLAEA